MNLQADIRTAVAATIQRHFHEQVQRVYARLQGELGVAGDISPHELFALEAAEETLGRIVGDWLCASLSFDQAEAFGMDGTGRTT